MTETDNKPQSEPITDKENSISPKIDKLGRAYATGRRKRSVSRVWIKYGSKKLQLMEEIVKIILKERFTALS